MTGVGSEGYRAGAASAGEGTRSGWPTTVGTIAVILAILFFFDELSDLIAGPAVLDSEVMRRLLAPEFAGFLRGAAPSQAWVVTSSLVGMALALLLWVAGYRLRGREISGVRLARVWAALTIPWVGVQLGWGVLWQRAHAEELARIAGPGWVEWVWPGLVLGAVLGWAFPIFLLVWLSRPWLAAEIADW